MKNIFVSFLVILFCCNSSFSQENKIGAMEIKDGTLLYFNDGSYFTIELKGKVDLKNYPLIELDNNGFQLMQNSVEVNGSDEKKLLDGYRMWEMNHINEILPEKVESKSEFIISKTEVLSFWYYRHPILKNASKDVTPYKISFFLDWRKGNVVFRIAHPSFDEDISKNQSLLLSLKNGIRYYSNKIDLEKLYENISKGQNFYDE